MRGKSFKNRVICLLLALAMLLPAGLCVGYADDLSDKKSDLSDINSQIDSLEKQLKDAKNQSSSLTTQIKTLEKLIYTKEVELNVLQRNINATKESITQALAELEAMEKDIAEQNSALNTRLRAMYKNGDAGILAVLFGSESMSAFMTNMDMAQRIYESDADLLKQLQSEYDELDQKKQELQTLKDSLIAQQSAVTAKKSALADDQATLSSQKKDVEADKKTLEKQIDALEAEANALTAEILKLQGSQAYIGGDMLWPCADTRHYVSSPFGNRLHPILRVYKLHTGIDIAAASGTKILAANAGSVISACYNSGYGYMVMIDHGGGIVTLYAHSSKLLVKKGDVVGRGDTIALVGSTGMSTGPHLHFEVRLNGVYQNPLNYVKK